MVRDKKSARRPPKESILIIDDEEVVRVSLARLLEARGFSVAAASSTREGLDCIRDRHIRIVLCDIMMPEIDGFGFLKKVRDYNLSVEVIMITGQGSVSNCIESLEKGASAYVTKPFQIKEILEAIERAKRNIREKEETIKKALSKSSSGG